MPETAMTNETSVVSDQEQGKSTPVDVEKLAEIVYRLMVEDIRLLRSRGVKCTRPKEP